MASMTIVADPPDSSTPLGARLCTACGLCCTGAIHDTARLDPDEVERAAELGLPVVGGTNAFALPCPKLTGTACSIFGSRPRVCGRYRCRLLQDVEAGAVELPVAMELVRIARELEAAARASLTGSLPEARYRARHGALPDVLSASPTAERPRVAAEKLHVTALDLFLDKHFRNDRDIRMYKDGQAPIK